MGGDNRFGNLQQWDTQAANPAAPAGQAQAAEAGAAYASGENRFSNLGKWMSTTESNPYTANAASWYTGFNAEGTNNGWDTEFTRQFMDGQKAAAEAGTLSTYFEDGGTGVVTWDHDSKDGTRSYRFGDIVEKGQVKGNVYDLYDKTDADLSMTAWLFDGKQQARIFSDSDVPHALANAVDEVHQSNNVNIPKALSAAEFQGKINDRAESLGEGGSEAAIVGGAAAGGAVTGASAGAALTSWLGPGAAVGAVGGGIVGGIVGGVGGFLNRDELEQQAARAYEITAMSTEENGTAAGIATGIKEWAGFSTSLTSPVTQAVHGAAELTGDNKVGDGKSGYYAVDEKTGKSTTPLWMKAAGLSAAVGDGLLQFVAPLNRAIYTAQMGSVIGGETSQMALTGGKMFDPREGGFDNIFVDDQGHADPVSAAAGILKVGIDAVQLGGWRGLASATLARAGSAEAGERATELAGHRFVFNEAGEAIEAKKTLALLAPSEQIGAATAARSARVQAMKEGRAVTADDFYRAANNLANGSRKLKVAMVNALGEGYEEAVQAILEPLALDGQLNMSDIGTSAAYGAAGGLGMSLGATAAGPGQDQLLRNQAYAVATIRNGGVEPDAAKFDAQWNQLSPTEKRVAASRSESDAKVMAAALERMAQQQAATLVATEVDAAKALDARRAAVEVELKRGTEKTDRFVVMGGQVAAGRVGPKGELLGDTAPAEALEASAVTIVSLLEDREKGLGIQEQFLVQRIAELEQATDAAAVAEKLAEARALARSVRQARQVGGALLDDIATIAEQLYSSDAAQAEQLTGALNRLLEGAYRGTLDLVAPEGFEGTTDELRTAGMQFATLLHSREPKLDAGSYLALLPRASWELTRTRSDNMAQVNVDVLAAINGDFDGDKLRSEYQLVLTPERFVQARAGQNLTDGAQVDVATRNFDAELSRAVAAGLAGTGALRDEAAGVLANIESAITDRYGDLMSPAALDRALGEFRTALRGGSEDARVTLLNALAREGGEAITNRGRDQLANEWLWVSKVVRANLQAYQTSYRQLRAAGASPTETVPTEAFDTPEGTNRRKARAVNDAQTLALFAVGNTLFRKFQKIHYTFFNSAVLGAAGAERTDLYDMAATYEELGRGITRAELELVSANDTIAARALTMLRRLVDSALEDPDLAGQLNPSTAMSVLANVKVKDVWFEGENVVTDDATISLAQLVLKRALDADREEHRHTFDTDEKLQAKHARLRKLTRPNTDGEVNAEKAFLELFGAMPFIESLGGVVGALPPHTTPEQWLRNYTGLDATGRQDMERMFTGVPEYLSRKETSNLPYSLTEAARREVTPYRSMLDALMAVGRAMPKDRARVDEAAREDFRESHRLVAQALADYRAGLGRRTARKTDGATLVQQMFAANPRFAQLVMDTIPNSAANALFEYRDGQLYVVPWVYETFAIANPDEALLHYWRNLTLAKRLAVEATVHDDDSDAPGWTYERLQSRFQRLLYQFAQEPGQPRLEALLRKMDAAKSLDEVFTWINTTPGMKGNYAQADLLPFHDDVAEFEADAAAGRWSTAGESGDLRAAFTALRRGAKQLRDTMRFREEAAATDRVILDGIKRAHTGDPRATDLDRENLRKLEKAVAISRELPRGFAPSAMLALTQGAVRGFDAHSHDKGVTADSYAPLGEFQALMDAFAFVPGLERVMETLTAHSIGSLRTNVGDLAAVAGTAMDAHGRPVAWTPMSVDDAIAMLDDSRTAPLAHALLTPTALDLVGGQMHERLLTEASLKDLLDVDHFRELFRLEGDGVLDRALRYISLVDSRARAEGGHFDAVRYVNDLTTVRLSGLGRPATEDDIDRLKKQAYVVVARVLQLVGQVQASPDMRDAGLLKSLRDGAVETLRRQRISRALPSFTDETGDVVEGWVTGVLSDLEAEKQTLLAALPDLYDGDELERRSAALEQQYAANEARLRGVFTDDVAGALVHRFAVTGDETVDAAARAQIVEFVRAQTAFPARAPEAAEAWSKLASQLHDGQLPDLTTAEWDLLARGAMGVALADELVRVSGHVSIPAFPKGDPAVSDARFYRYFDPAYTWLVTDLLAEDSPLTAAATWLHTVAEQPRTTISTDAATRTLTHTVLNRAQLGPWTPGLMSQLVETQQRMDSAAAGQAIAAAGNGPKRWAAVAAATRRTGLVPGPELASVATLTGDYLSTAAHPYNEIPVRHPNTTATMPVAQLDNRFVREIRLDGTPVSLDVDNLGFTWAAEPNPSGYRYVGLDRLRTAVRRHAAATGVEPGAVTIEVEFFHPDAQPAGPEWMNNAYFEGMGHTNTPDGAESLLATLWSDNGGQIAVDTQRPLDAGKKGLRAIQPFQRLDPAKLAETEALWTTGGDLAAMLRRKTELTMTYDDGTGTLDPSRYNAVYKTMKLAHIVAGFRDGQPAAMTAEEVIAHQLEHGVGAELPLEDARLVKLSPDVLRTMLGETGDQGVDRFFDDQYLLNVDLVDAYTGITDDMLARFGAGWTAEIGTLGDTTLANIGSQRVLRVRTMLTDAERNAHAERIEYQNARRNEARTARYANLKGSHARDSYAAVLQLAAGSIGTERATFDFGPEVPIAPRNTHEAEHSQRLLAAMAGVANPNEFQRGWEVVDHGGPDHPGGRVTIESLSDQTAPEHRVVKDDLALVQLDTFERPERDVTAVQGRVELALSHLVEAGATIALGSGNGKGDTRYAAAQYLLERGYRPVAGSKHLFEPVEFSLQTQNERAYESTLTETRRIRPAAQVITFLATDPIGTDENDAILNTASRKLADRKRLNNILPSASYPHYNLPVDDGAEYGLHARALDHLRTVTDPGNPEARAELLAMGGKDPHRVLPLAAALDRFHAKIANRTTLAPQVGDQLLVGDIIPFLHPDGRVILYRHGMKMPKPQQLRELQSRGGLNVALAPSETEPAATANSGTIVDLADRAQFGKTLALEVPLQEYGNKIQLEWNGMKYVLVPPDTADDITADSQLFANGEQVTLYSDAASANSKEAFEGRVWNYRNALAFFQYDFTDDLVNFFFPDAATRDPRARVITYTLLSRLAANRDLKIPTRDVAVLSKAHLAVADLLGDFAAAEAGQVPADWTERLADPVDASGQLARAVITYLLTEGAEVDNVLKSAGFSHPDAGHAETTTRLVPGLFADLLDQGLDSVVHAELIRRFDAQLHRAPSGAGFRLHPDWTVEKFDGKGGSLRGYLQFGEAHSSGDNPALDGQAFDINEKATVSSHNAMASGLSIGALTAHKKLRRSAEFAKSFTAAGKVTKPDTGASLWTALTTLPDEKDATFAGWRRETPAETVRRGLAREELVGFHQPLTTDDWTDEQKAEYQREATGVLADLNLYGTQIALVDTWIRDHLGRPHEIDEHGVVRGVISHADVMETLAEIRANIRSGLLPHAGANLPLIDVNHLTALYLANLNRADGRGWAPTDPATGAAAQSWDAWVESAFGTAWIVPEGSKGLGVEPDFDKVYELAVDGRMHGYQGATSATRYLPVAHDILRHRQLMDPETNRMLVSISADENLRATDPTLFNASRAQLEDIIGGRRLYGPGRDGVDPASAKGRQKKRLDRWRNEVDAPRQANRKMRGVRGPGQTFLGHTTTTSAFWRSMINLRAGNALFNIALVVSAPLEAFQRRTINLFANAAVGESTGAVGRVQTRIAERFADTTLGKIAEQLGLMPTYTSDELARLNSLVSALSTRTEFKSMVYKELMFQYPTMPGIGRVEKVLERYAKFGGRLQDPAWGMLPKDLARIYVETVMRKVAQQPTGQDIYSVDRLLTEMTTNPQWVQGNDLEAHNMAIAAIASIRSLKPNVLSLATRGLVEPLAESDKFVRNSTGNMLKMMTMFQSFWSTYAINIMGLQGAADFAAFLVDGREKSKLVRRMQNAIHGDEYAVGDAGYYDMSEVLESLDLADSFLRGGVTHAALFTLGLAAQSLGLSGEDDEEKWLRRQAELQGAGYVRDPRKLQNDFRNRDSIFLNWLPLGLDSLFRIDPTDPESQSLAQMNWVTRSILSPVIGFERFYNTGDFSEVIHGFGDAIGAHPIVNEQLWNAATDTAAELHAAANDAAERDDHQASAHLLITAVGVMERMMLENSMVNMIYVGADRYDRDPYAQPRLDSDGNAQLDVRGNPYETDVTQQFRGDDGTQGTGYVSRDDYGAQLRTLTENRFGLAFVGSLFSGLAGEGFLTGSDLFRTNMAVKERQIELPQVDPNTIDATLAAAMQGQMKATGAVPVLSQGEAEQIIKNRYQAAGIFWDAAEVEKQAKAWVAQTQQVPLSVLTENGREVPTEAGARAVLEGLRTGAVNLGDAALNGFFITYDQRTKIQTEWMKEIKQEGVDLGLTDSQATYRMKRIWFGDSETGTEGLYKILWSKEIPGSDTLKYNQLNTTYVTGPNGFPMATGFTRDGLFGALGLKPLMRAWSTTESSGGVDSRMNFTDTLVGVNTGLRALEPRRDGWEITTPEEEIRAAAEKIADAIGDLDLSPSTPYAAKSGGGYGGYGYGHRYGGGYGGGGGGYYQDFTKMYALPGGTSVYGNTIPFINTSNPIIRRADVRRERVWSERGRLKQWQ